jgi:catabolite regulation protein CreA
MARYKAYDRKQAKMIPLSYADQVVEGSFEHALDEIVEEHVDLAVFDERYTYDETAARFSYGLVMRRQPCEVCARAYD